LGFEIWKQKEWSTDKKRFPHITVQPLQTATSLQRPLKHVVTAKIAPYKTDSYSMTDKQCKQNPIFIVNVEGKWSNPRVVGLCFCLSIYFDWYVFTCYRCHNTPYRSIMATFLFPSWPPWRCSTVYSLSKWLPNQTLCSSMFSAGIVELRRKLSKKMHPHKKTMVICTKIINSYSLH